MHADHDGQGVGLRAGEEVEAEGLGRCRAVLSSSLKRGVLGILPGAPRLYGWCRTRWSCAPVALELYKRRRLAVSGETVRRWLPELGGEGKRAKVVAKDDDPQRVEKVARIRLAFEQLRGGAA